MTYLNRWINDYIFFHKEARELTEMKSLISNNQIFFLTSEVKSAKKKRNVSTFSTAENTLSGENKQNIQQVTCDDL